MIVALEDILVCNVENDILIIIIIVIINNNNNIIIINNNIYYESEMTKGCVISLH